MDEALGKLVERALAGAGAAALRVAAGDLVVAIGPTTREAGFVLTVGRPGGRVGEREAVDVAVRVHRLMDRAGAPVESEMLAYRGPERTRCFVLALRERALA